MKFLQIGVTNPWQPNEDGKLGIEDANKCPVRGFPISGPASKIGDVVFFGPGKIDWISFAFNFDGRGQGEVICWLSRQIWLTTSAAKPDHSQRQEEMMKFGFCVQRSKTPAAP